MNSQYKEKAVIRIVDDDEGFGDAIRFMLKTDGWLVSYYSETGTFLKKDDLDAWNFKTFWPIEVIGSRLFF